MSDDFFQLENDIIEKCEKIVADPAYENNSLTGFIRTFTKLYKNVIRQNKKFISIGDKQQAEIYRINELLAKQNHELEEANQKIRQQESIIIQQEKLAVLGDIIASTAHEISTPLLAITLGLETIQQQMEIFCKTDSSNQDDQAIIQQEFDENMRSLYIAADMIRCQINNMKSFIKFQEKIQDFDVNSELNTTINIMNYKTLSNMEVHKDFADNLPLIRGNAAQINQVFMNLIKNAVDAKNKKLNASLTIKTYQKDDKIIVEFIDNGKGIDKESLSNFFSDNFSSSTDRTGRGLAMCYEIIKQHNGVIEVESELEVGTTIRLILN